MPYFIRPYDISDAEVERILSGDMEKIDSAVLEAFSRDMLEKAVDRLGLRAAFARTGKFGIAQEETAAICNEK